MVRILFCFLILFFTYPLNANAFKESLLLPNSAGFSIQDSSSSNKYIGYRSLSECKTAEELLPTSPSNAFRTDITNLDSNLLTKVLVFKIDFDDRNTDSDNSFHYEYIAENLSAYFNVMSEGKFKFRWIYSSKSTRMPRSLQSYGAGSRSQLAEIAQIIRDAQVLAFEEYQIEDYDYLIVVPPSTIAKTDISTSISILQRKNEAINSTILAYDFWESGQSWAIPAHEIGHALGLLDLYSYESANQVGSDTISIQRQFQFMHSYDLMNWPTGPAPELTAWSRWQLGFLDSKRIKCLPKSYTETKLEALESEFNGIKALVYKINEFQVLVIENRQPLGFDYRLPTSASGVIVYLVNLREESGNGPLRLLPLIANRGTSHSHTLHPRQSFEFGKMKIECVSISKYRAVIRVKMV